MRIVLQRVKSAAVAVDGVQKSSVENGFLLLVGFAREDTPEIAVKMAQKISRLRIFEDDQKKMNLDISQVRGGILSVPQFTLLGNTEKGNRPGFDSAADQAKAKTLWEKFNDEIRSRGIHVEEGEFGAHMEVSLINDGPVTLVIDRCMKV